MSSYNPRLLITSSERAVSSVSPRHNDGAHVPIHLDAIDSAMLSSDNEVREQEDNDSNVEDIDNEPRKKRSRFQSNVWQHFTTASQPQYCKSNICNHCRTLINYHKKSGIVKIVINNFGPFRKLMNGREDVNRPE